MEARIRLHYTETYIWSSINKVVVFGKMEQTVPKGVWEMGLS